MKGKVGRQVIIVILIALVYSIVVYLIPFARTPVFYVSWAFTLLALFAQIYIFRVAFRSGRELKSRFYGFPIMRVGLYYAIAQLVLGIVFMLLGEYVLLWIPLVLYIVLAAAAALGLVAADSVRNVVEQQEIKVQRNTSVMRGLRTNTEALAKQTGDPEVAKAVAELAEALRYSDPVSSDALRDIEGRLSDEIAQLCAAVAASDAKQIITLCDQAQTTLKERNLLCRKTK